ncbi:hypothetical protein [Burkholderia plantarii]|uniref:hypothetical protein n=1 Tax=Burkholderia plantarii TaxID=41899 RepID=UPI000B10A00B|nr:hypothetical protein [Burkholderia plantarii]WLE62089.1 hypothetical protein GIY62_32320 [Burkholderia plantarii]
MFHVNRNSWPARRRESSVHIEIAEIADPGFYQPDFAAVPRQPAFATARAMHFIFLSAFVPRLNKV